MTITEILTRMQADLSLAIVSDTEDALEIELSDLQDALCSAYGAALREENRDRAQERKEEEADRQYEESRYAE